MTLLTPPAWPDYELIDSGDFMKLERFGSYVLARPEPQAIWDCSLPETEWERLAHATFRRDKQSPERGDWQRLKPLQDPWTVQFRQQGLDLTLKLALTSFKHVGLFPEQAVNWTYLHDAIRALGVETGTTVAVGGVRSRVETPEDALPLPAPVSPSLLPVVSRIESSSIRFRRTVPSPVPALTVTV